MSTPMRWLDRVLRVIRRSALRPDVGGACLENRSSWTAACGPRFSAAGLVEPALCGDPDGPVGVFARRTADVQVRLALGQPALCTTQSARATPTPEADKTGQHYLQDLGRQEPPVAYPVSVLAQGALAPDDRIRNRRGWQPVQAGPSPGAAPPVGAAPSPHSGR